MYLPFVRRIVKLFPILIHQGAPRTRHRPGSNPVARGGGGGGGGEIIPLLSVPPTPPRTDPQPSSIWRRERPPSPSGLCAFTSEDDCDCAADYDLAREARQAESPGRRVSKVIVVYFDRDGDA
ncbi:uncharacterized protein PG986_002325 [Apiospora aurea]|uniref:Uncharacterized protein n=1 Tax=Apiospora aurea TaxID=335848 RepID=A0ABR1QZG6_9PEZI